MIVSQTRRNNRGFVQKRPPKFFLLRRSNFVKTVFSAPGTPWESLGAKSFGEKTSEKFCVLGHSPTPGKGLLRPLGWVGRIPVWRIGTRSIPDPRSGAVDCCLTRNGRGLVHHDRRTGVRSLCSQHRHSVPHHPPALERRLSCERVLEGMTIEVIPYEHGRQGVQGLGSDSL